AELTRRLQGAALALPLSWIEQQLLEEGVTLEQIVHDENAQQAANQVTIRNGIASLRRLGQVDWRNFVETMSVIEHKLSADPAGIYSSMDFATRDRYRQIIERLARISRQPETAVAAAAIQLAQEATGENPTESGRYNHVGFYLIDAGLHIL